MPNKKICIKCEYVGDSTEFVKNRYICKKCYAIRQHEAYLKLKEKNYYNEYIMKKKQTKENQVQSC